MTISKMKLLTADDLLRLYNEGVKGELVLGVLCETVAAGIEHGEIAVNIAAPLRVFVRQERLGRVIASDAGIRLERGPDTVREPDVAFISAERLPLGVRVRGYSDVVPDLVVEIISPSDSHQAVHDKACMWLYHGVTLVWVVDPDRRTVTVRQSRESTVVLGEGDMLDGSPVLPGFAMPVAEVFE